MSVALQIYDTPEEVARHAADFIAQRLRALPDATLLVATGNTPMPTYAELARRDLDMRRVRAVQLDEYLGVDAGDPRSLYAWMYRDFVRPLGVEHVLRFEPDAPDPDAHCGRYAERIRDFGGIDLAILGLGPNGHVGFNEPPSGADAPTRVVTLSDASVASNASYWGGLEVPRRALTVGMDLILESRACLLLVTGEHKRDILWRTLHSPLSPDVPASLLRKGSLTVVADRAAYEAAEAC